jgi:hypothetical protein
MSWVRVGQDRVGISPKTPQRAVVERDFLIHESSEFRREFRALFVAVVEFGSGIGSWNCPYK